MKHSFSRHSAARSNPIQVVSSNACALVYCLLQSEADPIAVINDTIKTSRVWLGGLEDTKAASVIDTLQLLCSMNGMFTGINHDAQMTALGRERQTLLDAVRLFQHGHERNMVSSPGKYAVTLAA